jgi:glycosyltransferase involved in cell wall biosynthesis|nr:glycosyltransferase family 2 protein [uncultured Flavobacterium sp.]
MHNLVSIIIPCYNQAHFLDETLQSVLSQTYSNWECIIVNDGSPDNTEAVAKVWAEKDSRFIYFAKQNGGLSSARNAGLKVAKGDFIQFLDSDDILGNEKLEVSVNLSVNEGSDIVITDFKRFRKTITKLKRAFCDLGKQEFSFDSMLLKWDVEFTIPIHCGFFKKALLNNVAFHEELKAKEDWKFWIDIFRNNPKVSYVNKVLVFYRLHDKGMTRDSAHMDENHNNAYLIIYNSLDDKNKIAFVKRLIMELEHTRKRYKKFKDNIFYRKIFYSIKRLF